MDMDVTALYAPSMAQVGLPSASMPPDYWGSSRTLRSSKALHSHKSKYNVCNCQTLFKDLVLTSASYYQCNTKD